MRIERSIALVTGANGGLGQHFVAGLIAFGADKIYACARDPDTLAPLLEAHGERIVPLRLDVTDPESVAAAAARATDLTLLVNNAGVLEGRGLMEAGGVDPLRHEMEVNVFGLAAMCLAFAPVLGRNGGAIVNMLSVAGLACFPPFGSYSASKAAATSLTQCLRYELKDRGVEVFGVYAGFIDTAMIDYVSADKSDPRAVVREALEGVEGGLSEIDADPRSKELRAALRDDPAALEAAMWERAEGFRTGHPVGED
jgi:NAD(P)-dependent dehydrogenase (short-subunit alcohol dehydrogenase family)